MAQRHGGVTTFGVLGIVFGLLGVLLNGVGFFLLLLAKSAPPEAGIPPEVVESITGIVLASVVVNAITSVMVFVAGIGVFGYKPWARNLYMWGSIATIVNRVVTFPMHFSQPEVVEGAQAAANQGGQIFGNLLVIVFSAVVIWFFRQPHIIALFEPADTIQPGTTPTPTA